MNVLVLAPYQYDTAPGQRFRLEQWARLLKDEGVCCEFVPFESRALRRVLYTRDHARKVRELAAGLGRRCRLLRGLRRQAWDAVIVHRELLPFGPPVLEHWLARQGVPVLFDFDDAIFLPEVSDANRRYGWLKWPQKTAALCRLSTHTIVGNRYLEAYARRFTDRVTVLPTSIDLERYQPKPAARIEGIPTVGWSGSLTTLKHLRGIEEVVRELSRRRPLRLKVVGNADYRLAGVEVAAKAWHAAEEVADLRSFDVGIMPLPDDPWARGKCGLKLLQYMAVGVPTVASPVGVNAEIVEDGRNGFLAATPQEWLEKLTRLLEDEPLRARFAAAGRRTVEERFSGRTQAARLKALLERVCGRPGAELAAPIGASHG